MLITTIKHANNGTIYGIPIADIKLLIKQGTNMSVLEIRSVQVFWT